MNLIDFGMIITLIVGYIVIALVYDQLRRDYRDHRKIPKPPPVPPPVWQGQEEEIDYDE